MELNDAFKAAAQKFFDNYEYSEIKKMNKDFKYSYKDLDEIHKEVTKGRGKSKPLELEEDINEVEDDIDEDDNESGVAADLSYDD